MHTQHVEYLLPEYIRGTIDDALRAGVESHLAGCAQCRGELEILQATFHNLTVSSPEQPSSAYFSGILPRIRERLEGKERRTFAAHPLMTRLALPLAVGILAFVLLSHVSSIPPNVRVAQNPLLPAFAGISSEELVEVALDQMHRESFPSTLGDQETSSLLAIPVLRSEYLLSGQMPAPDLEEVAIGNGLAEELNSLSDTELDALVARLSERTVL